MSKEGIDLAVPIWYIDISFPKNLEEGKVKGLGVPDVHVSETDGIAIA